MSWASMKKAKDEAKGGLFIKLKDGDFVEGIFRGQPHFYYQKFGDRTEYDTWAEGRSFKFKIPFVINENGAWVAKIYQGGAKVRDQIFDMGEEYGVKDTNGDLVRIDAIFKIKRTGSGKDDTRYSILFKGFPTAEQLLQINAVKLPNLKGVQEDDDSFPPPDEDDDPTRDL